MIGLAGAGMRPQRLVEIGLRRRVFGDFAHDAAIAPDQAAPLRADSQEVEHPPRIEDQRIEHGHAGAALLAELRRKKPNCSGCTPSIRAAPEKMVSESRTLVRLMPDAMARRMIVSTCASV